MSHRLTDGRQAEEEGASVSDRRLQAMQFSVRLSDAAQDLLFFFLLCYPDASFLGERMESTRFSPVVACKRQKCVSQNAHSLIHNESDLQMMHETVSFRLLPSLSS